MTSSSLVDQVSELSLNENAVNEISVTEEGNVKTVVEERVDDQGRKIRITRKIRLCKVSHRVPKAVAERRSWPKYGDSADDKPGPNLATTVIGEAVYLKLAMDRNFDQEAAQGGKGVPVVEAKSIVCQYCQGAHWTIKCPYKSTFANARSEREKAERDSKSPEPTNNNNSNTVDGKYVPPSMRGKGDSTENLMSEQKSDAVLRLSNLSEIVTEGDLRTLCSVFGPLARVYVAKDHRTFKCRGFAYVTFESRADAEKALGRLNGHRYGNLILKADWSEPSQ